MARAESVRLASSHSRHSLPAVFGIFPRIDAVLADELLGHEVDQPLVPIVAAELHVAVGGQGDELAAADLHHGHVERAAAQVVDQELLRLVAAALSVQKALAESRRPWRRRWAR